MSGMLRWIGHRRESPKRLARHLARVRRSHRDRLCGCGTVGYEIRKALKKMGNAVKRSKPQDRLADTPEGNNG